jgi:small subunit ribosomal protein S17
VADEEKNEQVEETPEAEESLEAEEAPPVEAEASETPPEPDPEAPPEEPGPPVPEPTSPEPTPEPVPEPIAEGEEAPVAETEAEETPVAEAEEAPAEEPAPEEAPAEDATPEEPAAPAATAKAKRKRVPRSDRRKRAKTREQATERKPIARLPKPEHDRGRRQERRGVVVSAAMDKTIVVRVDTVKAHPKYKKVVRRSQRFHAHDEENQAKTGDVVRIIETRPLSKTKNWRLAEVVEAAR